MTELAYFKDTYVVCGTGRVLEVIDTSVLTNGAVTPLTKALQRHPHAVILDATLFYPQGGGQPTDTGRITGPNGHFTVAHVFMDNKRVYHQGTLHGTLNENDAVDLAVDEDVRMRNARCHSAGHVIFSIIKHQWGDQMTERKGHHFSDGAYVEFSGVLSEAHDKTLLEEMVARVVAEDRRIIVTEESTGNDVLRVVQVDGYVANPCGGTHVRSTAELGHVTIRKIARRAGQNLTKISYCVA
ncbi:hypothetical protein LPJ62_000720 [Coemansia sp. RSA 2167]|nr:hypothetical protein LPJ62_000720 [Coemansia sp. RSA 2167]KAJ2150611.1 hypothetical protein J3F82_003872 [Coemansia sp. RSA 637]KAJ2184729.1 hypothetical protein EV181_004228 [Coemansia sp. RSA 532]KAJ2200046.1 hypothetical protein IW144_001312 [Coemansia sp. RSA 522]KAJ2208051.1 hypothetical protein IW145_001020 [Coemansia sp. RSA 521]KAJ2404797.1 hypothetical protein J3F80_004628 [Coemansia sp. RSA 2526]KAJ2533575.1 hypothetical protein IWW43_002684 [Coemansia sp. RSA 1935]KAJ2836431.1 